MIGVLLEPEFANVEGLDCRASWLLGPGLADFLPDSTSTFIPFVMKIHKQEIMPRVWDLIDSGKIYVHQIYLDDNRKVQHGVYFSALAPYSFFDELFHSDDQAAIELRNAQKEILLCSPMRSSQPNWKPNRSAASPMPSSPMADGSDWADGTVVIGVIDDGIAIAHENFRNEDGTRIQYFWRQYKRDNPPNPLFDYGREYEKSEIDSLISANSNGDSLNEDSFYRQADLINFSDNGAGHRTAAWRGAHGTHVLDLAGGYSISEDQKKRPIIAVQLSSEAVADSGGALWEDKVKDGVEYILHRAGEMSSDPDEKLPVVINISFGTHAGPHDGTNLLERDFDEKISTTHTNARIILPAGNANLSRCHAQVTFDNFGDTQDLLWRAQPDDRTTSWLHIWMPHNSTMPPGGRIKLRVQAPDGTTTPALGETTPDLGAAIIDDDGDVICLAINHFVAGETQRSHYCVALSPTARLESAERTAPSGLWKIRLKNLALADDQPGRGVD